MKYLVYFKMADFYFKMAAVIVDCLLLLHVYVKSKRIFMTKTVVTNRIMNYCS